MRVCLVSNEFAPFHGAGIGTYASLMAAAWAGAGHETHVLTGAHAGVLEEGTRLRPGVRFHTVDPAGVPSLSGTWAERYAMGVWTALQRLHAERPFDYIEFPDYGGEGAYATWARRGGGALAGAVLGVRLHTPRRECRALNLESWLDEEGARVDALEDGAIGRADVLISPSASLLEILRGRLKDGSCWPREAVVPYPFGADAVTELLPDAGAAGAPDLEGPPVVLYYGRLERRKGVHLLVEAARRMLEHGVDATFRFIGGDTLTGPLGSSMRTYLEGLAGPHSGRRIVLEPPRPRNELGEQIRRATVVCVPSLWENFPNVVLESMALGAAVVGSDAGGIGEIIRDRTDGLLFRAGDAADLERVLRLALSDEALRRTVRAGAPGRIAGLCDPGAVVAQTIAVIGAAGPAVSRRDAGAAPDGVSVVVVGDQAFEGLEKTLDSIARLGDAIRDRVLILRGGAGQEFAEGARERGFDVIELPVPGPGAALLAALPRLRGTWIMALEPGDVLPEGAVARLLAGADGTPGAAWIGGAVAWNDGSGGQMPVGLERDLLAAGVSPGPGLVRRAALERVGGWDDWLVGEMWIADWGLACRLAAAGEEWAMVPEVVITRPTGRGAGPIPAPAAMHVIESCPGLPRDPGRAMRILAARTPVPAPVPEPEPVKPVEPPPDPPPPGPRRSINDEAVFRQRLMEENLRYRIADRVSGVLKATGVQRPFKAMVNGARRVARRLAGG